MSSVSDKEITAYNAAHYHVFHEPQFVLKIGQFSRELSLLHKEAGMTCSAFITADNPLGVPGSVEQNKSAYARLIESVSNSGLSSIDGEGKDPAGEWPGEKSLLIIGCDRQQAVEWGGLYNQNAIVWCGDDAIPELIVL